jgi:hypothetical protein
MIHPSQDHFVGIVAIVVGLAALAVALSGGRLAAWSAIARGLERRGGKWTVIVVYTALALFLIGVGISLLT